MESEVADDGEEAAGQDDGDPMEGDGELVGAEVDGETGQAILVRFGCFVEHGGCWPGIRLLDDGLVVAHVKSLECSPNLYRNTVLATIDLNRSCRRTTKRKKPTVDFRKAKSVVIPVVIERIGRYVEELTPSLNGKAQPYLYPSLPPSSSARNSMSKTLINRTLLHSYITQRTPPQYQPPKLSSAREIIHAKSVCGGHRP